MSKSKTLVLIGFGKVASFVNRVAVDYDIKYATTRSDHKVDSFKSIGLSRASIYGQKFSSSDCIELADASYGADVLVSFPPDGVADLEIAKSIRDCNKVIYISSTSVYGERQGVIDDKTQVDHSCQYAIKRNSAEKIWSDQCGAVILRAPALYGPGYGLHKSLLAGQFKIPGDGTKYSSRIHLLDLANIALAVFNSEIDEGSYVVGDRHPATHMEVVTWLCKELKISLPETTSIDRVHHTLKSSRQINPSNLLNLLEFTLKFPDFKTGFKNCLECDY